MGTPMRVIKKAPLGAYLTNQVEVAMKVTKVKELSAYLNSLCKFNRVIELILVYHDRVIM